MTPHNYAVRNYRRPSRWLAVWRRIRFHLTVAAIAVALLALMGMLDARDKADTAEHALVDCMNGHAYWHGTDGVDVGCMPAEINERTQP